MSLINRENELYSNVKEYILDQNPKINHEIIKLLFYQPYIRAVHIVHSSQCGITSRQTATNKLKELMDMNMLSKREVGRETVYINNQLIDVLSQ